MPGSSSCAWRCAYSPNTVGIQQAFPKSEQVAPKSSDLLPILQLRGHLPMTRQRLRILWAPE
eukprot:5889103-Pyramimonas_sp.AAC.1